METRRCLRLEAAMTCMRGEYEIYEETRVCTASVMLWMLSMNVWVESVDVDF